MLYCGPIELSNFGYFPWKHITLKYLTKRYRPPACTVEDLPAILDAILISHTHYDHLDFNSVKQIHKRYENQVHWFVPSGSRSWFESLCIASDNIHDMIWWQSKIMPLCGGKTQNQACNCGLDFSNVAKGS